MAVKDASWVGLKIARRYQVSEILGRGGMGYIYKAHDEREGREVVLKVPRPRAADQAEFAGRFRREIRSLWNLAHPNIVRVLDVGEHDGLPFAVLEYLSGGNLSVRRRAPGPQFGAWPPDQLLAWLADVAAALDFIHTQHYVHRDVKPDNILFDGQGRAYLSDFGVVKVLAGPVPDKTQTVVTMSGMVVGTPKYMAPEVIMAQYYDGRADQYALAITVYEWLSGRPPLDGPTPTAVMMEHVRQPPPPLHDILPAMPRKASAVVQRGMAKNPEHRFPDCIAFTRALMSALGTATAAPPPAPRPAAPAPRAGWLQTPRGQFVVTVLAALAVMGVIALLTAVLLLLAPTAEGAEKGSGALFRRETEPRPLFRGERT
jgi:serine/threonine-protein kinase